jgi:SAM-dependent methyltransferase
LVREQRLVFGEVAGEYEDVRAGYADELVTAVFDYLGRVPERVVEVGAGTGKGTAPFAARGVPVTCVEPDPAMAAVLSGRFPDAEVVVSRFEDWTPPPGGVPLLVCGQAWHWVDGASRLALAHAALAPGGVLALFGHRYGAGEPPTEAAINEAYAGIAPELLNPAQHSPGPDADWMTVELAGSPLFTDVMQKDFQRVERYPTERYIRLLNTFSPHRMLPEDRRARLFAGIAAAVDAYGGVVRVDLRTVLALGVSRGTVGPSC